MLIILLIPLRQRLTAVMMACNRLIQIVSDPYRPERHYMRGPGPKWHARHQTAPARVKAQ